MALKNIRRRRALPGGKPPVVTYSRVPPATVGEPGEEVDAYLTATEVPFVAAPDSTVALDVPPEPRIGIGPADEPAGPRPGGIAADLFDEPKRRGGLWLLVGVAVVAVAAGAGILAISLGAATGGKVVAPVAKTAPVKIDSAAAPDEAMPRVREIPLTPGHKSAPAVAPPPRLRPIEANKTTVPVTGKAPAAVEASKAPASVEAGKVPAPSEANRVPAPVATNKVPAPVEAGTASAESPAPPAPPKPGALPADLDVAAGGARPAQPPPAAATTPAQTDDSFIENIEQTLSNVPAAPAETAPAAPPPAATDATSGEPPAAATDALPIGSTPLPQFPPPLRGAPLADAPANPDDPVPPEPIPDAPAQ